MKTAVTSADIPRELALGWSRTLFIGWLGLALALICTGGSSQMIGRPVWWLDNDAHSIVTLAIYLVAIFALPAASAISAIFASPLAPWFSACATAELIVLAVVERHSSPGSAVVIGALSFAAALVTAASFAGLVRPVQASRQLD